jgi:O-antigen/teichoic acid export membrane protein
MSATGFSQLIPIIASPILTRIYSPEQFGFFASYMAIASILGVISTGRFELASILPKNNRSGFDLTALSIGICTIFCLLVLIFLVIFGEKFALLVKIEDSHMWLYFLPLTIFLSGLYQSLSHFLNRKKLFQKIAVGRIIQSGTTSGSQIIFGKIFIGMQLLTGQLVGQLIGVIYFLRQGLKVIRKSGYSWSPLRTYVLARRYSAFVKLDAPTSLVNITANQMPNILLAYFYSPTVAGFYFLTQRVLQVPVTIISSSVLEVFKGEAAMQFRSLGNCTEIFKKTLKTLFIISIFPVGVAFIYLEEIFLMAFGEEWFEAGLYAKLLMPALFLRFIANPLSFVLYIAEKQKYNFFCMLILLMMITLSLVLSTNPQKAVFLVSMSYCCYYIIHLGLSYRFSKGVCDE